MSDADLDREWKSNHRPQSRIAQDFSIDLNQLFKIDCSISDLDAAVCEKKKSVQIQTSELQALEARLKETEERLIQAGVKPSRTSMIIDNSIEESAQNIPIDGRTTKVSSTKPKSSQLTAGQLQAKDDKARKRAFRYNPRSSAGLPPTPDASEDGDSS
ncbi:hypothetical protein K3495_g2004 [Podosphaera aphanis]|nr:hypothetical protein K3495_g2004 [Podosphaera aphanis]